MTEQQREQIIEMRAQGNGYKSIATVVGLSRDVVRNYCKYHNLTGHSTTVSRNIRIRMEKGEACSYCGATIVKPKTGRPKRFCSDKCRRSWWKNHPEARTQSEEATYQLVCVHCGSEFTSYGNKNRKYCCHDCYIKERFWKGEDYENSNIVGAAD